MSRKNLRRFWMPGLLLVGLGSASALGQAPAPEVKAKGAELSAPRAAEEADPFPLPLPFLKTDSKEIDLRSAFRLAGVENPEIFLARQRVLEAVALRQLAAAQFLPNINMGGSYDAHIGVLQQSNGHMLKVNRDSLYVGLGANAVAAGTVNIPGIQWWNNPSTVIFNALISRQRERIAIADNIAVRNDVLLRVASDYVELLRAEGKLVIALQNRFDTSQVARITAAYAQTGQGTAADADRAATDLSLRDDQILQAQNDVLVASARLAEQLNLDPAVRLHAIDGWVVPAPIVPPVVPLPELLGIALMQRPELTARRAAIAAALLALRQAKVLPFSPNMMLGYSYGSFGGGSNLVAQPGGYLGQTGSRFGEFSGRQDTDIILYWTAQNMGVGNLALIRIAGSNVASANLEQLVVLNQVRDQVATAFADTQARYALIGVTENAVRTSSEGFQEDLTRIRGAEGRPIEVLDSVRLLTDARYRYLAAICDYNRAQFALYVALGQPPADQLARPIPPKLVPPAVRTVPADCPAVEPAAAVQLPRKAG